MMSPWGLISLLLGLLLWLNPSTDSLPLHMDSIIQVLAQLEQGSPTHNHTAPGRLLAANSPRDAFLQLLLEMESPPPDEPDPLSPVQRELASLVAQHSVDSGLEHGVVLAPDGSTVAVAPLLAGLEAGLRGRKAVALPVDLRAAPLDARDNHLGAGANLSITNPKAFPDVSDVSPEPTSLPPDGSTTSPGTGAHSPPSVDNLLAVTLARALGLAFLPVPGNPDPDGLGSDGCWDRISKPKSFSLMGNGSSALTVAFLNGALDGALLGDYLSRAPEPRPPLNLLLSQYYGTGPGDTPVQGVAGTPDLRSNFRRQNAADLISQDELTGQVWASLLMLGTTQPAHPQLAPLARTELAHVAARAAEEFTESFLKCPAILPRCRWQAAPYRGSPVPLRLPLGFMYIHHTYIPHQPCTTFHQCTLNMRGMQTFHQDDRGWDDIGYSFVVGSDGYVYEGRGWHWVGAHTRGVNSKGFGVSFIGNYTAMLPDARALHMVRDALPHCALRAGYLHPDYIMHGHRQVVATDCPGEALYQHIRSWPHFKEVEKKSPKGHS
ncbi:N-acetylmuramoyl-L-alanine amidase [Ornithorhynchus anatinus]|uniref:Peptidoglycan recognition protein 2 n=1 Tax=Ornithorhynchus anatinus TaxID=9258 RepID=F6WGK2_ORNAN|nr:N-acetylmuramoyl-L-alanine amidase [Ornithorhynchus anatinus]